MRKYKPEHGESVSPHQLELTADSRVLTLNLSRKERQMLLALTFRTDVEENFGTAWKIFTGKTFDGYVKGSKSLVGHFIDIDATVTSFEVTYDRWGNTTIDLQATNTNNSRLR